jgi:hypothetical protein
MKKETIALLIFIFFVTTYSIPESAKNKNKQFTFKEDLSIGLEYGDENLMFGSISNICLDAKENIYVLDWKNFRIQKFDTKGNFFKSFVLKKGQGPQEISSFPKMAVNPEGIISILDSRANKVLILNEHGELLQSFKTSFHAADIAFYSSESIVLLGYNENKILHVYGLEGNHLLSFGSPFEIPSKYSQYENMPNIKLPMRFDCSEDGRIFVLNPHKYEIHMYKDGNFIQKIKGENEAFKALMVTKSNMGGIGIIYPVVYVLAYSDRLYVTIKGWGREDPNQMEVFDNDRSIASFEINGFAYSIDRKGRLYFSEENEFPKVSRYLLKEK